MKSLSSLDIHFMLKELRDNLIGAKFDKAYQSKEDFLIAFHKQGKKLMRINASSLFLTEYKFEQPRPPGFCMFLRKRLNQSRLREIIQRNFERIVEFHFETKEGKLILIIELFSKGNVILVNEGMTILIALHNQVWKDRTIKPKVTYIYPPALDVNILNVVADSFKELHKENLVKSLAIDFKLGGKYAEEICHRAGLDKNLTELSKEEIIKLLNTVDEFFNSELKPNISAQDVFPIEMESIEGEKKPFETYSQALDFFQAVEVPVDSNLDKKKAGLEKLAKKQKAQIEAFKISADRDKLKGDLVYKNYAYIEEIFKVLELAKAKKYKIPEVKEKLKTKGIDWDGTKFIVELD